MAVKEITLPPGQLSCLREVSCGLLRNVGACTVGSGEASERGSWPLVKHRGKVSFMSATSLSSCWAARSAYFTGFLRHSKNSRGTRQSLRASSRTKEVLHSCCLVEDIPEKSELTLPTLVQYRYVPGSVLHKGHLRCQNGGLRDSAGGAEP